LDIPLPQNSFDKELKTIKFLATRNGYPEVLIEKMLEKKLKKRESILLFKNTRNEKELKWCKLPYYGWPMEKMSSVFPKDKYRPAYYNRTKLRNLLCKTEEKINKLEGSGIYKLNCNGCDATYVGQTGRAFQTRAEEHKRCFRNRILEQSRFAKHLWETGHSSDFILEIIHQCRKGKKMDVLEELEIKRNLCSG
jgi:hypothetical protein